jgi:hypothetical protein
MKITKKHVIAAALAILGTASALTYKSPATDAKKIGDLPSCQASCTTQGCFCNRSCILWYCWGDWYCQCSPN